MQTPTPAPPISKLVFFDLQNSNTEVDTAEQKRSTALQVNNAAQVDQEPPPPQIDQTGNPSHCGTSQEHGQMPPEGQAEGQTQGRLHRSLAGE